MKNLIMAAAAAMCVVFAHAQSTVVIETEQPPNAYLEMIPEDKNLD